MIFCYVHVHEILFPKWHVTEFAKILELVREMNILHVLLSTAPVAVNVATKFAKNSDSVPSPLSVLSKVRGGT